MTGATSGGLDHSMVKSTKAAAQQRKEAESVAVVATPEVMLPSDGRSGLGDGGIPAGEMFGDAGSVLRRLEVLLLAPGLLHLRLIFPDAGAEARQERGTEGGGLHQLGARDLDAEDVGLKLHQQVVGRRAAVDLEHGQRAAGVALH